MTTPYTPPSADMAQVDSEETYQPKIWSVEGRIGRLRYLGYGMLVPLVILLAIGVVSGILAAVGGGMLAMVPLFLGYVVMIASSFVFMKRRLNDLGKTGWMGLLSLVPFVNLIFGLYLVFAEGEKGRNQYGPAPCPNPPGMVWVIAVPFISIFVIGILAAIALPAYQDYVNRAKAKAERVEHVTPSDMPSALPASAPDAAPADAGANPAAPADGNAAPAADGNGGAAPAPKSE